jgi:hypothetical protein
MDGLTFVSSLVASLAWPVTVLALALLFRGPLRRLFDRLPKRVKAGPVEVEWPEIAAEARVALATAGEAPAQADAGSLTERFVDLAKREPAAAVMAAWAEIEKAVRDRMAERGALSDRDSVYLMVDLALRVGAINAGTAQAVKGLIHLRNLAAHGRADELDTEKAIDYLTLADATLYAIQTWKGPPPA